MKKVKTVKSSYARLKFEEEPVNLDRIIEDVLDAYPKVLLEYRGGVRPALDKLISEVMKKSGGRADPKKIKSIILSKL